jgi:hypothetical protein
MTGRCDGCSEEERNKKREQESNRGTILSVVARFLCVLKKNMPRRIDVNYTTRFIKRNSLKAIAFVPLFARMSGSLDAGLFMSQLLFWWKKGDDEDWIYKTLDEIRSETMLTRYAQDAAIEIWGKLGILRVDLRGSPPIRHFNIDLVRLEKEAHDFIANLPDSTKRFVLTNASIRRSRQNLYQERTTKEKQQESSSYRGTHAYASSGTRGIEEEDIPNFFGVAFALPSPKSADDTDEIPL